jgi:hypothetical protein
MSLEVLQKAAQHQVEALARGVVEDIAACRYNGYYVQNHLAPHFLSKNVDIDETTTREDFIGAIKKTNDANFRQANNLDPSLRMRTVNSISEIDKELRRATVWVTVSVGGISRLNYKGIEREGVIRMRWTRVRGAKWLCIRAFALRGPGMMYATVGLHNLI